MPKVLKELTDEDIQNLKIASLGLKSVCNAHVHDECRIARCMEQSKTQDGVILGWAFMGCANYRAAAIIDRILTE